MCVCMYVMYVCIYVHTSMVKTSVYLSSEVCMHICIYVVLMYVCLHVCM